MHRFLACKLQRRDSTVYINKEHVLYVVDNFEGGTRIFLTSLDSAGNTFVDVEESAKSVSKKASRKGWW